MKQSVQVRLSQHLALTPQLQQSSRLLQLSTLELNQEVEQMLAQNPLLEPEEDFAVATPELAELKSAASVGEDSGADAELGGGSEADATPEIKAEDFGTTEREDWENGTERDDFDGIRELPGNGSGNGSGEDDGERGEQDSGEVSLQEHLIQQLAGMGLSAADRMALR